MRRTPILGALVAAIALLSAGVAASATTVEHGQYACLAYHTVKGDAPLHLCATVQYHNASGPKGIVIDSVRFTAPGMTDGNIKGCDRLGSPQWKKLHGDAVVNGIHMYANKASQSGCPSTWHIGLNALDNNVPFTIRWTANVNGDVDPTMHGTFHLCRSATGGC